MQLAKKFILVMLIDFQTDNTDGNAFGQISNVLIVLVLFFVLQEFIRPYEFAWCNRLEFAWTAMSLIILVVLNYFSLFFEERGLLKKEDKARRKEKANGKGRLQGEF